MGKKVKKAHTPPKNNWMNTYADMVTLLFCFFVLLFAMSELDVDRFRAMSEALAGRNVFTRGALGQIFTDSSGLMPEHSPPIPMRMDPYAPIEETDEIIDLVTGRRGQMYALADTFRTYMAPYDEETLAAIGITVSDLGEYLRITFDSGMLFDSGQAVLRPESMEVVDYVVGYIARNAPGHRIAIQVHTDDIPINTIQFPCNFHLSAARGISVMRRMIYYHGFDPMLLSAEGMGEYRPVDTNYTVEGRANNRRVEIKIFAQQEEILTVLAY